MCMCVCVVSFYVYENLGQKNTSRAMVVVDVPLRSQLLCTWEKRRRNCNISRQLSSLLFGEEFLRSKNVRHYLGSILRQNQTFSAKKHFDLINN